MKYSIALLTLAFALDASASCPLTVSNKIPAIPDGSVASKESIHNAGTAVQSYVENIEHFLDCRGLELSDRRYNELVDRVHVAAASYNTELDRYKQRKEVLAKY